MVLEQSGIKRVIVIFSATYNNDESNDQNGLESQYDEDGLTHHIEYKDGVVINERVEVKE